MNGFIITQANYVTELTDVTIAIAKNNGVMMVDMNGTACKVPDALEYIAKMQSKGQVGKKKKTVKC